MSGHLGSGSVDEPAFGFAFAASRGAGLLRSGSGSLVFDVADRQPQQLDDRVVAGEVPAVLDDLAQLIVEAFDAVGRVDDLLTAGGNARNGMNRDPGACSARP